ncbi:MAG TPA: hypothetical protein VG651_23175 [Stellaceae bacterium]|nr:hypothetical protein [Stellaceae bacterium]
MAGRVSGTEGYTEQAESLLQQYENLRFDHVHRDTAHLFPAAPATLLDIGSGTGRDAAGFAARKPTRLVRTARDHLGPAGLSP